MDTLRAVEDDVSRHYPAADEPRMDPPPAVGGDERRMHVRAYNHWVSLLDGRSVPMIDTLDPAGSDFGAKSVLLDFTRDIENPTIAFVGDALRAEGGIGPDVRTIAEVPGRSLVSRLTDHVLQIIANRAPVGFEAEFVNDRGSEIMYRGILMPFTSDGSTIDYIYGVINWKERASDALVAGIAAEIGRAAPAAPLHAGSGATAWAPDPAEDIGAQDDPGAEIAQVEAADPLDDQVALARGTVDAVETCEMRLRSALYRALSSAYDLALAAERNPAEFRSMLRRAGIRLHKRVPMAAVARLVFGSDADPDRIKDAAAALACARRRGIESGGMRNFLENHPGGLKGVVKAERRPRNC